MAAKVEMITIKCAWCRKEIQRLACKIKGRTNVFCCRECAWKFNGARASAKVEKIEVKCANYGKLLLKLPSDFVKVKGNNHFCSKNAVVNMNEKQLFLNVIGAGRTFLILRVIHPAQKHFCNTACHSAWRSANTCGANNPLYNKVKVKCTICNKVIEKRSLRQKDAKTIFVMRNVGTCILKAKKIVALCEKTC